MSELLNSNGAPIQTTQEALDETPKRKQEGRKESHYSWEFHTQLTNRVKELGKPGVSMGGFDVFCCQNYRPLAALELPEAVGYLSIKDVAECFNVEYKTVYRMIKGLQIPAGKIAGVWRIPASGVVLYHNVGVWHQQENDKTLRLKAMSEGDLSVLETYQSSESLPNMWNAYVQETLGEVPTGCGWADLIEKQLAR